MNAEQLVTLVKTALADIKAQDVISLDVTNMTSIADHIVIASGTSSRHVKSIADRVIEAVKEAGVKPLGTEGDAMADWVLVDIGDVVLHVMTPATRQFYDLERLWSVQPGAAAKAAAAAAAEAATLEPAEKKPAVARKRATAKPAAAPRPVARKRKDAP
jgi:ribosome-associated protein